jgi:hypothetical protein
MMNYKNVRQVGSVFLGVVLVLVLAACSSENVLEGELRTQDFGTPSDDRAYSVAAPRGGVGAVVVGQTGGSLDGAHKGGGDAFIRKYDGGGWYGQSSLARGPLILPPMSL